MAPRKVFVSAGESSGDLYAASLVRALRRHWDGTEWFGCVGPRMQAEGVRAVAEAHRLSVVGLVEVLAHLPRIYREFRKLVAAAKAERPALAILTDSPDFHLRLAAKLRAIGVPVIYLVAPQAWAWRSGRVKQLRANVARLLCLFPFEEAFFRRHGIAAVYIGHPLARLIRPQRGAEEFFARHRLDPAKPLLALCPGSRPGEIRRHLPVVVEAARRITREREVSLVLAAPLGFHQAAGADFFREPISGAAIQVIEGETWDVLSRAAVVLAASGTVTMEAALLGTPMVTYYKVATISWLLGRVLVRTPFFSMPNLIAGRRVVPELMQNEMTAERLAECALRLLNSDAERESMRRGLAEIREKLACAEDPMERAAKVIREFFDEQQNKR